MTLTTLVTSEELVAHLDDPLWVIVDCRFDLQDAEKGRRDYLAAHIPGAVYAHLNNDLAGPPVPGQTGWHPLPTVPTFAQTLSRWGIDNAVQVVAYDDWGGAMAARLWWMLRWVGHEAVAVLDGGWPLWQQAGYPTRSGEEMRPARSFIPFPREDLIITTDEVQQRQQDPSFRLLDTRPPEMYSGTATMADLPAGHIPGARSFPLSRNLGDDGRFLLPEELRARYRETLAGASAEDSATYCVSGVTSTHNLLAMLHAGLGEGRLYVGSWSEWSGDPQRPTEQE